MNVGMWSSHRADLICEVLKIVGKPVLGGLKGVQSNPLGKAGWSQEQLAGLSSPFHVPVSLFPLLHGSSVLVSRTIVLFVQSSLTDKLRKPEAQGKGDGRKPVFAECWPTAKLQLGFTPRYLL